MNSIHQAIESTLSDADLLDAWSRDGHRPSLNVLVCRYSRMVSSVCRRRCRSEADADDAYQSTFLYLARNAAKIRHPERLPGWLHRVAQRAATATLHAHPDPREPFVEPPVIPTDPWEQLAQRHAAMVLDEELADLPAAYRAAIVLHLGDGMSVQDVADRLETTTGSIRGRLQRGKRLLASRLRRRGVVPIAAFAAASSWSVNEVQASTAATSFADGITSAGLPDPPINTARFESLLTQGVRAMPSLTTATGIVAGTVLLAVLLMTVGVPNQAPSEPQMVTLPAQLADQAALFQTSPPGDDADARLASGFRPNEAQRSDAAVESGNTRRIGLGGGAGDRTAGPAHISLNAAPLVTAATSETAMRIQAMLDQEQFGGDVPISLSKLTQMPGLPVFVDDRAIDTAGVQVDPAEIRYDGVELPLRAALRKMLQPHGLKAVVEDDGLIVTADFDELAHRGLPMSWWINITPETGDRFAAALDESTSQTFDELPLFEAVRALGEAHQIPIVIDRPALEEIGLSPDEPITLSLHNVSVRSLLNRLIQDLSLTYTIDNEVLQITTTEAAEAKPLTRIYFLEGTGFAQGDDDSIIETIQTTFSSESWEQFGGSSAMTPLRHKRPAIIVSTVMTVHEQIERFLEICRESHFGAAPRLPAVTPRHHSAADRAGEGRDRPY